VKKLFSQTLFRISEEIRILLHFYTKNPVSAGKFKLTGMPVPDI